MEKQLLPLQASDVFKKLQSLSPERIREVEDFIDFLTQREEERGLVFNAMKTSEMAFEEIWDNPEDAVYDQL
jgi:hypothetical protein